jgi:hypothetical protein
VGLVPLAKTRRLPDTLAGMGIGRLYTDVCGRNDRQRFTQRRRSFEIAELISFEEPVSTLFDEARMRNVIALLQVCGIKTQIHEVTCYDQNSF